MSDAEQQAVYAQEQIEHAETLLRKARATFRTAATAYQEAEQARRESLANLSLAVRTLDNAKRQRKVSIGLLLAAIIVLGLHYL